MEFEGKVGKRVEGEYRNVIEDVQRTEAEDIRRREQTTERQMPYMKVREMVDPYVQGLPKAFRKRDINRFREYTRRIPLSSPPGQSQDSGEPELHLVLSGRYKPGYKKVPPVADSSVEMSISIAVPIQDHKLPRVKSVPVGFIDQPLADIRGVPLNYGISAYHDTGVSTHLTASNQEAAEIIRIIDEAYDHFMNHGFPVSQAELISQS